MKTHRLFLAAIAAAMMVPAFAADEADGKKKGNRRQQNMAATQLLKQLEPVGLTDEQTDKIKELGKVASAKMAEIRKEAGITPELVKKRAEVQKAMKDSDKKGKELIAAINEEAGYSEAQAAGLAKSNAVRQEFRTKVIALLTEEQKEKLPKQLARQSKQGERKGKGKNKEAQ